MNVIKECVKEFAELSKLMTFARSEVEKAIKYIVDNSEREYDYGTSISDIVDTAILMARI